MHPFFEPLSEQEVALLLTTLTVGGSAETAVFEHIDAAARGRLQEKAQALLQIDTAKRVPFMVRELKESLSLQGLRGVERVDASWIINAMKGESPRVVAAILVGLPPPLVRSVLKRLPSGIRQKLPPKEELKSVNKVLLRDIRQRFEARFHAMPKPSPKGFAFRDVIQLDRQELFALMRDLGLIELGQAFVSVGKMALAELCRRLPRDKAEELIIAVKGASQVDAPDLRSAQRFLSRVVVNFKDTEEFFQKAGLWRLAKASILEGEAFQAAFAQRLPREMGELYRTYLNKAGEMGDLAEDVLRRTQDSVLLRIRELSKRTQIGPQWATMRMSFHAQSEA